MDKIIKKLKNKDLTYKLGYDIWNNKIYPRINIYKNNKLLSYGRYSDGIYGEGFVFDADIFSSNFNGTINTMKEMFNKLRQYIDIPQYIETEFEELFILYKLNNFKE